MMLTFALVCWIIATIGLMVLASWQKHTVNRLTWERDQYLYERDQLLLALETRRKAANALLELVDMFPKPTLVRACQMMAGKHQRVVDVPFKGRINESDRPGVEL